MLKFAQQRKIILYQSAPDYQRRRWHGRGVEHHWYINSLPGSKGANMFDNPQDCRVFWALWTAKECYIVKRHVSVTEDVYLLQH